MARIRTADPAYFNAINVTPFIDVMLVLLVVIILSLPLASHKLPLDLPQPSNVPAPAAAPHQLAIDRAGALYFDGRPVADADLPARLAAMQADATAVLQMNPDPESRYERFDEVLAMVRRAGITRLGFVGNRPLE